MRIKQGYFSDSLRKIGKRLLEKYRLKEYGNPPTSHQRRKPCLFFGCYTRRDVKRVCAHEAFRILIWTGGDLARIKSKSHEKIFHHPEIVHIALSGFTAKDLRLVGLPYVSLPVCVSNFDQFQPKPLGPQVYVYGVKSSPEIYGGALVERVQQALPDIPFLIGDYDADYEPFYPPEKMHKVYEKCFMGLRLTTHDGLPNTVAELGLMGRKCVWNGSLPNAIPWWSVDDIVSTIRQESVTIGENRVALAGEVRAHLDIGKGWLSTEYYQEGGRGWNALKKSIARIHK